MSLPLLRSGVHWLVVVPLLALPASGQDRVPIRPPAPEPAEVVAPEGGTQFGRVLDTDGEPVSGAHVWIFVSGTAETQPREARTDTAGRFAIDFPAGHEYSLHARASGVGSTSLDGLALDPWSRTEPITLTLRGGRTHSGRVLDSDGTPFAGLQLFAVPAGFTHFPDARELEDLERAGGLCADVAVADIEGHFSFPALVDGEYAIYARWDEGDSAGVGVQWLDRPLAPPIGAQLYYALGLEDDRTPSPGPLAKLRLGPHSNPIELRVPQHRVEVRVVDHLGAPVAMTEAELENKRDRPVLDLHPLSEGQAAAELYVSRPRLVDGRVVYLVEPERSYVVSLKDSRFPYAEAIAEVPGWRQHVPLELRLGPRCEPAHVTLRVVDPTGQEYTQRPHLMVVSAATGRRVVRSETPAYLYFREGPRSSTWNVELPPGRFRVHASAEPTFGCVISRPLPRAPHLPATLEIELLPDAEETFVLELGAAGQLDFESLGRGPAPGEVDERLFDDDPQGSSDDTRTRVGGTWMRLYDEAGAKIADLGPFEVPGLRAGAAGLFGIDWLVRGWPARCLAPLPVGRWTLRAENEHGVVFEREITIEEGQVTTVRW